jgi:hypothetical protein
MYDVWKYKTPQSDTSNVDDQPKEANPDASNDDLQEDIQDIKVSETNTRDIEAPKKKVLKITIT